MTRFLADWNLGHVGIQHFCVSLDVQSRARTMVRQHLIVLLWRSILSLESRRGGFCLISTSY